MVPDDLRTLEPTGQKTRRHPARSRLGRRLLAGAAIASAFGTTIYMGVADRVHAEEKLAQTTAEAAVPSVTVVHPQAGAPNETVTLPGYTSAFVDTPIYARTSGYLTRWHFDIGAHVKKGDLLAEIDTPEIDQQLRQARGELATAQANLKLAAITAKRNEDLVKTRSVSTQERDNADGALDADKAIVQSNEGNVARLEQLQSYEKVYALFDGIITARNTDVGALIGADANSPSKELFHLAAIDTLRVYVSVPEIYSKAAAPGATASLTLDEFPGETFHGTLERNANAIDLASRTLLVEVDVDNPSGRLLPGAYAFVHLDLPTSVSSVTIPANTLLFRKEGPRVAVVRNSRVVLMPINIGRDYGETVEVLSGLQPADEIITDPADSLVDGAAVRISDGKLG
ncbi:MAG: efflux transporter periplasmic adaptor subunit [Gammaproteobacteria bacterium]|nr:efflux transporter periplasmic adaptor subunit [Gammaproteobacteria bacterium]